MAAVEAAASTPSATVTKTCAVELVGHVGLEGVEVDE